MFFSSKKKVMEKGLLLKPSLTDILYFSISYWLQSRSILLFHIGLLFKNWFWKKSCLFMVFLYNARVLYFFILGNLWIISYKIILRIVYLESFKFNTEKKYFTSILANSSLSTEGKKSGSLLTDILCECNLNKTILNHWRTAWQRSW